MKLLPRIIGRGCECCRLFTRVCVFGWVLVCVCVCRGNGERAGGGQWIDSCPSGWGAGEQGEANRLFPQSVPQRPPLTHGAARRRAGSHGKRGTNKTTAPIHKSQPLQGRRANRAGWRSDKKEGEEGNGTKKVEKARVSRSCRLL